MKIAFILYPYCIVTGRSNGIRSQAITWADGLRKKGHKVDLISEWDYNDWETYDVIHLFGPDAKEWMQFLSLRLSEKNDRIVYSPIIDPEIDNYFVGKLRHIRRTLISSFKIYQKQYGFCRCILARSVCESDFLIKEYGIPKEKVHIVPLSYSYQYENAELSKEERLQQVFHMSSLYQDRKNVKRLILAAKKYGFKLVLAGSTGNEEQKRELEKLIGDCKNIQMLGFVSESEKKYLYEKSKVFVLPSLQEGVGIVALDAALLGCEVVITKIPGPGDYYSNNCFFVDPMDVDDIGTKIIKALDDRYSNQPGLSNHIRNNYSPERIIDNLIDVYKRL